MRSTNTNFPECSDQSPLAEQTSLQDEPNDGVGEHFSLRRWKFEHWFAQANLGSTTCVVARAQDGHYLDPHAALAWRAWNEAVATATDIPAKWDASMAPTSRLGYEFKWLFGIETEDQLAHRLAHEPRLFEMAVRHGYLRPK